MDNSAPENDVADIIVSKGYLPNEKDLPKTSIVKNVGKCPNIESHNATILSSSSFASHRRRPPPMCAIYSYLFTM